jgi:hypothetical protein
MFVTRVETALHVTSVAAASSELSEKYCNKGTLIEIFTEIPTDACTSRLHAAYF